MSSMQVKVGGVWKPVKKPSVKVGGVWKPVKQAFVKDSGVWKSTYIADTYTFTVEGPRDAGSGRTQIGYARNFIGHMEFDAIEDTKIKGIYVEEGSNYTILYVPVDATVQGKSKMDLIYTDTLGTHTIELQTRVYGNVYQTSTSDFTEAKKFQTYLKANARKTISVKLVLKA